MDDREFNLRQLLDAWHWQSVQDALARLAGVAVITIDFKGDPVGLPSGPTPFCEAVRALPVYERRCLRCRMLAGLESVRRGRFFPCLCHCGVLCAAVPIQVDGRYLGAVLFGGGRLPEGEEEARVERLVGEVSIFAGEGDAVRRDLAEKFQALPELSVRRMEEIGGMLEALLSSLSARPCAQTPRSRVPALHGGGPELSPGVLTLDGLREPPEAAVSAPGSSPIYPALVYLLDHPGEMVSMSSMAELCHLSPSYFSRLFHRETGETFVNYMNRQKIELAKKRLTDSRDSVSSIAYGLGFRDVSYFISVFKRIVGVTPLDYRRFGLS